MLQPVLKKCLLLAALAVAGVTLSASPAQAGWGHWRAGGCGWYGYGYYPAYAYTTSYWSPCVTRCGWSNPCWSGCYSGYYASYYAPSYGYYGAVSDCCNSVVVEPTGEADAVPTPATPAAEEPNPPAADEPAPAAPIREPASVLPTPPEPKPMPAAPDANLPALPGPPDVPPLPPAPSPAPNPSADRRLPSDAALLTVVVPQDATVYVNGMLTKTPGTQRQYVSYGLRPGYNYTYEVRVLVTHHGEPLSDVQFVRVRAGEERELAFDFAARSDTVIAARMP